MKEVLHTQSFIDRKRDKKAAQLQTEFSFGGKKKYDLEGRTKSPDWGAKNYS